MPSLTDRFASAFRFFYPEKRHEPQFGIDPELGADEPILAPRAPVAEVPRTVDVPPVPPDQIPVLRDVVALGTKIEPPRPGKYSALSVGQLLSVLQHHGFAVVQYATCSGSREGGIEAAAKALHRASLVDAGELEALSGILKAKLVDIVDLTEKDAELFERCMPPELARQLREMETTVPPIKR